MQAAQSTLGSTISLYLAEGRPGGLRVVRKDNWNGVGLDCARADFAQAKTRREFGRSGVYLLLGDQVDAGGLPSIYIGEADELGARLSNHAANKEFWTRLVIFTGQEDGSINKAHARHLESRLYELATTAKRSHVENKVPPGQPMLTDQDRDMTERFLGEMLVVLPVIGVTAFQIPEVVVAPRSIKLFLKGPSSTEAEGEETSEGFKVFSGSRARADEMNAISNSTKQLRADLTSNQVLKMVEGNLVFTQDYVFTSSSAAAAILVGGAISGPQAWRTSSGKTLKEIQEDAVGN
jgi:Domain of unknown function (DUF4357)